MEAVRHIGIVVDDLEKSVYFYRELLGLKMVRKMDEAGKYLDTILAREGVKVTTVKLAADNGVIVELLSFSSPLPGKRPAQDFYDKGYAHVAFTVKGLDKLYKDLLKAGLRFNSPPQGSPDGRAKVVFLKDPEGNLIELVEEVKN